MVTGLNDNDSWIKPTINYDEIKFHTNNNKNAIIVDIDGCFTDSRNLNQYYPTDPDSREQWDNFQDHSDEVTLNKFMVDLVNYFSKDCEILFITGREARGKSIDNTINIIKDIKNCQLIMRPENDYRDSDIVKRDLFTSFVLGRYNVLFAIDDKDVNINMWIKDFNIPCMKVILP